MTVTQAPVRGNAAGPDELLAVLDDVAAVLSSLTLPAVTVGGRDAWSEVVRTCQHIVNAATGVQDAAIVRLCAIEPDVLDDGTILERHHAPGHVSLDGPALVSSALDVTAVHAERRVRGAVRLAADGEAGTNACTGLGGLHDAMRAGALDPYRASVVAEELEEAPPEVAETVVATLGKHLTRETGPQLRRRTRRLIARISPDLLHQRAKRAREECGLRRWVDQPGVDRWEGTFPSEDAATAWAAIDARAQQLVTTGTCDRIERARAQALVDLVTGNATITTIVILTTPATDEGQAGTHPTTGHDTHHRQGRTSVSTERTSAPATGRQHRQLARVDATTIDEATAGVAVEAMTAPRSTSSNQGPGAPALTAPELLDPTPHHGPPNRAQRRRTRPEPEDLVEVPNPLGGEPMLVARAWLDALIASPTTTIRPVTCDPATGALRTNITTDTYRPPKELADRIRRRDGRCRFPGCHVNARFCDIDHVRAWPTGPTADHNLICLCRRHHRIKQRPGWHLTLHPDATVTWTDPTGRQRTTAPIDALRTITLPRANAAESETTPMTAPGPAVAIDAHSSLEFALEHLLGSSAPGRRGRRPAHRTVQTLRLHGITVDNPERQCHTRPRFQRRARTADRNPDTPPF
ncbi:HNH endonuclease signature motif containing protein [Oryzobacter telluris]|uniref:HNH endonuclease signature motif containing protein n=1 Tax=Oryzobacter telluris TaxID=3149179 RepID=UPI00370D293B